VRVFSQFSTADGLDEQQSKADGTKIPQNIWLKNQRRQALLLQLVIRLQTVYWIGVLGSEPVWRLTCTMLQFSTNCIKTVLVQRTDTMACNSLKQLSSS